MADPIKLGVNALLALAEGKGIDVDTIKENPHEDPRNGSEQDFYEAARTTLQAAIETSNRSGSPDTGQQGDAGEQEGLTVTTPEQVRADEERAAAV